MLDGPAVKKRSRWDGWTCGALIRWLDGARLGELWTDGFYVHATISQGHPPRRAIKGGRKQNIPW